jgi:hypothetical protein
MEEKLPHTYWNGVPVRTIRGTAVLKDSTVFTEYWARVEGIIGTRIPVVMILLDGVNTHGGVLYLDDRKDEGWVKVTEGYGMPTYPHKTVYIEPRSFERL